jgi:hypothetical protein
MWIHSSTMTTSWSFSFDFPTCFFSRGSILVLASS